MKLDWTKTISQYRGRFAVGGIDLSSVDDLTCCVYEIPEPDDRQQIDVLMRTWCPQAKIYDKKNKYRDQYQNWQREGWIEATEGNAVDYDLIRKRIVEAI